MRDTVLAPGFYHSHSLCGRYVFMDKGRLASLIQKRSAVDTILQHRDGSAVCIEEKIVRWPGYRYTCYCLETRSCTVIGHESPGWMCYGEADYLLYCFAQEDDTLEAHLIDFPRLKAWFWPLEDSFETFQMEDTVNHTFGRKVPIAAVCRAVPVWMWHVWPTGSRLLSIPERRPATVGGGPPARY
jgi:hypothetical protein